MASFNIRVSVVVLVGVLQIASVLSQDGYANHVGKTTGGAGGEIKFANTEAELRQFLENDTPRIVKLNKVIQLSSSIKVGSNKSILGANANAGVSKFGFHIHTKKNVIIKGLKISSFICTQGRPNFICHQGVQIEASTNIYVGNNEFFADFQHDPDFYTMAVALSNGADYVTVAYNRFHHIVHTFLIGGSDGNKDKDFGKFHITIHHNWFFDVTERTPMIRFGTAHIYNNLFERVTDSGIAGYCAAELLIERNVFNSVKVPLKLEHPSITDCKGVNVKGAAVARDNSIALSVARAGSFNKAPYDYSKTFHPLKDVAAIVKSQSGVPANPFNA